LDGDDTKLYAVDCEDGGNYVWGYTTSDVDGVEIFVNDELEETTSIVNDSVFEACVNVPIGEDLTITVQGYDNNNQSSNRMYDSWNFNVKEDVLIMVVGYAFYNGDYSFSIDEDCPNGGNYVIGFANNSEIVEFYVNGEYEGITYPTYEGFFTSCVDVPVSESPVTVQARSYLNSEDSTPTGTYTFTLSEVLYG
jgi:hypothetical protein